MKWFETDYFKNFKCKCGDCRSSCCDAWEIAVSEEEFHRLSNLACSDALYRKIQCAFCEIDDPTPGRYRLFARNFIGQCPMHAETGLCSLQVEQGESVLPEICRVYPRSMHSKGGKLRAVCSAGCEAVIELLDRKEPLHIIETEDSLPVDLTQEAGIGFFESFLQIVRLLQDRSLSFKHRIDSVCRKLMPEYLPSENGEAGLTALLNAIGSLKQYSPVLSDFSDEISGRYKSYSDYVKDLNIFERRFPEYEILFENIFVNHILYQDFPETDPRISASDSAYGLCFAVALAKLMCVSRCCGTKADIIDALTNAFRYIEHTSFYYNARVVIRSPETLAAV